MNYLEFNKILKEDKLSSIYLFLGEEVYLIDDTIERIKNKHVDESLETLNYTALSGKLVNQEDVINACETLPFMAEKKLVVLKELGLFIENGINDEDEFYDYIGKLGDHCIFLIADRNSELKKNTKFYKRFKKNDRVVEFNKLTRSQLQGWIKNQLKDKDKEMSLGNINYFMDRSSYFDRNNPTDIYHLKGELNRIIDYSNEREIKKDDIEYISQASKDNNIFDMIGYMSDGKGDKALEVFNELHSLNEPAIKILFMITRQIRLLINYKLYSKKGYSDNQIRDKLKISPYEIKKISSQSKRHDIRKLKKCFYHILETDKKLKTSSLDDKLEMEMLIIRISTGIM